MKHLYTYGLSLIVASSMAIATSITTTAPGYKLTSNIALNVEGPLSGDHDWVGIYKKGSTNDWNNVLGWSWVENPTEGLSIDTIIDNGGYSGRDILLDGGDFEARLFFNNSYHAEASTPFYMTRAGRPDLMIVNPMSQVGDTPQVLVNTVLSGDQDWVGIYPINSDNSWSNVIAWNWVKSNGVVDINKTISGKELLAGEYEARLFFHNEYGANAVARASSNFIVSDAQSAISTTKNTYAVNELVAINIDTALSGDRDWVGIFPKNSDNSWGNVLGWNWVENGSNVLEKNSESLPAGEYEIRLFFHNEYGENAVARASYGFSVGDTTINYAAYGDYDAGAPEKLYDNKIYIYKPKKNGIVRNNAPIVIFSKGGWLDQGSSNLDGSEEFMKYISSKGYVVIGVHTAFGVESEFQRILGAINQLGNTVDTSKIGLTGASTGGGRIFYHLRRLKEENYATTSFIMSLDGYTALNESTDNVRLLETTTLLLQFGGADGLRYGGTEETDAHHQALGNDNYQDPRILMALYNILPGNEKSLSYLNNQVHGYMSGSMNDKEDLRRVIGAMLSYKFENAGETARNIVLGNDKYNEIDNSKLEENAYRFKCNENRYNYCDVFNPTQEAGVL